MLSQKPERSQSYVRKFTEWANNSTLSKFYTRTEVDDGFEAYRELVNESKTIEHTGIDFVTLTLSMRQMPNLKKIIFRRNSLWKRRKTPLLKPLVACLGARRGVT